MSTLHAVVIRHLAFEDLGSFAPLLGSDPWNLSYLEAGVDDLSPAADADLLVVLGGPIGVNEEREYPFLSEELALLEKRLAADRPTLGICLGAQLIAKALGAQVYPGPAKEIGWSPLSLSSSGADSCLAAVDGGLTPVLHWHGDTFDLPDGCQRLASTPICVNQAFSRGPRCLALQFHVEVSTPTLERWYIGHTLEIASTPGVSVTQLRADGLRYGPKLEEQAREMLNCWLAGAGLV